MAAIAAIPAPWQPVPSASGSSSVYAAASNVGIQTLARKALVAGLAAMYGWVQWETIIG